MAGRLLFVILMYSFHKIQVQALLPPKLTVNPPMITETDSVTLNCQTPSSVSVSQCYFNTLSGENIRHSHFCLQTLTGTELLLMAHQRSPAEVKVKCFYTVKLGELNSPSPHSDTSSIAIQSQKPQMNLQHFHGDHVLFTCSLPGSANDTRCNLYFGEESHPVLTTTIWKKKFSKKKQRFCQFTVTIDDLLRHLHFVQQSDASCDYSLGSEPNSLSPRSDGYSLTDIVESESSLPPTKSAFTMTTDLYQIVSRPHASTFVTPVRPESDIEEKETRMMQNKPTFTTTTGLTVSRPHASTFVTPAKLTSGNKIYTVGARTTGSFISTSQTPVKPVSETVTANFSTAISVTSAVETPTNLVSEADVTETWIWKLVVVVAGFGVTVGVILLGLALLCTKRRTEISSYKRTQANVTDDYMFMRNLDHGGSLPAGDGEAYSVITSLPGADCRTGSEKLNRQEPQNEDSDVYHVYSIISEDPPASALKDMVYSTLQAH